jgi:hypothetical protein
MFGPGKNLLIRQKVLTAAAPISPLFIFKSIKNSPLLVFTGQKQQDVLTSKRFLI